MKRRVFLSYPIFYQAIRKNVDNLRVVVNLREIQKGDLVIFPGGDDISPSIYGERKEKETYPNPNRDRIEINVLNRCLEVRASMFGICRGLQLILAVHGSKLIQDIRPPHPPYHPLEYHTTTIYRKLIGDSVNSLHHQGVPIENLPPGFELLASFENIVEVAQADKIFVIQSHPEFDGNRKLFDYVIKEV